MEIFAYDFFKTDPLYNFKNSLKNILHNIHDGIKTKFENIDLNLKNKALKHFYIKLLYNFKKINNELIDKCKYFK
ncbi:hypothetical protein HERIO_139 [Hepatospora eriocheir]|uniref:Uncharacterized protein n=1 Tax=Hepatospora eriocheir TaxID=1081669 RepID=A0A1X0QE25_9MICR|nr:hypothetical protein HERIO_139 [Hepatospora eriocheir]